MEETMLSREEMEYRQRIADLVNAAGGMEIVEGDDGKLYAHLNWEEGTMSPDEEYAEMMAAAPDY